ncbi:MAG: translation elongation factor Ts [bacterium]|nr:translation elongation factor Ts [bacterium]MDZ4296166.1 translation elongation factor Ts [Patescibacteria group bacterium]
MPTPSVQDIKFLRDRTGMSLADCRQALIEARGDRGAALAVLAERGAAIAEKKSTRETHEGRIEAYIHGNGKIAALVELQCETDFVARNELFKGFAHDAAMQVAAMNPESAEALLGQAFIRDPNKTVGQYLVEIVARLGENIKITRFARWEL